MDKFGKNSFGEDEKGSSNSWTTNMKIELFFHKDRYGQQLQNNNL